MPIDAQFIRDRITELRLKKDVSEHQMSLQLGRGPSYIRSITSENKLPSIPALFDICEYFEITPLEFFNGELAQPERERRIVNKLMQLETEELDVFEEMLDMINHLKK